jgi:hypothetical protein
MTGADRHPDLAVGMHAPDAWPMAGARVDDDDRRFRRIDNSAFGRNNAHKPIVGGARQLAPVKDELIGEVQHIRNFLRRLARWTFPRSFRASRVRMLRCHASLQYSIAWSSIVEFCNGLSIISCCLVHWMLSDRL